MTIHPYSLTAEEDLRTSSRASPQLDLATGANACLPRELPSELYTQTKKKWRILARCKSERGLEPHT